MKVAASPGERDPTAVNDTVGSGFPRSATLRSSGARGGVVMAASMVLAGAMDYAVNVVAGRWLGPPEFGVFVSVTALMQVALTLTLAIRVVVAFHTAGITAQPGSASRAGAFMRRVARWSWRWGLLGAAALFAASEPLARLLQLPGPWPIRVASAMVLMLFLREGLHGALQGVQAFAALGFVQLVQATLRLPLAAGLMWAGAGATGAIAGAPLGAVGALALGVWWLRGYLSTTGGEASDVRVRWSYALATMCGLAVFGLLVNLDALFVKRFFPPDVAGDYGTVVTFEKVSLFLPSAVGLIMFPKVAHRAAAGRDARPLLLAALGAALAPGLAVTAVYATWPGPLVRTVFRPEYSDPGLVLGLVSLAATLYAGVHIWLNYALSTGRRAFIVALAAVLAGQGAGMFVLGRESLTGMALAMVAGGVAGNLAGYLTTWRQRTPAVTPPAGG